MPSDRAAAFIGQQPVRRAGIHRARTAAMLFADGNSSACSASSSVNCCRRDGHDRLLLSPPAVGVGDIGVGERDRRAVLAGP
jgi:hypothetical protein